MYFSCSSIHNSPNGNWLQNPISPSEDDEDSVEPDERFDEQTDESDDQFMQENGGYYSVEACRGNER